MDCILRWRPEYVWRDIGSEVVILNEKGTQVCLLSKTAATVWTSSDGATTLSEIAAWICERYDAGSKEALADVAEFAGQLVGAELATWVAAGAQ